MVLQNACKTFTVKQIKDTFKSACEQVYSGDYDKLGNLMLALDMFILCNDMGDDVYKQKCEAVEKLKRVVGE